MAYVFLSHAHDDKPFARYLAADLRAVGHSVWIDEAEIGIGDSLIDKIRAGLDQVDFVCAILSRTSIASAWVQKELEIASLREIDERRVVVLPLLLEDVPLPGFLKGKLYADFRKTEQYDSELERVLAALGPVETPPVPAAEEMKKLRAELTALKEIVQAHAQRAQRAGEAAFRGKSDRLRKAIEEENEAHPEWAPINRTYAFEIDQTQITLGYALWAVAKALGRGHPLDVLLTIENRWDDLNAMLEAYADMLASQESKAKAELSG